MRAEILKRIGILCMVIGGIGVNTFACTPPSAPVNTTNSANLTICYGNSAKLSAKGNGKLGWYSAATGGTYLGGDSTFITPTLLRDATYYVQDSTCAASVTRTAITINVIESVNAEFINGQACNRYKINFEWKGWKPSGAVITKFSWNFNNKDTSTLVNPSILLDTGIKKITLTLKASNGCIDSVTKILNVRPRPTADFTFKNVCEGDTTYFINQTQDANLYYWKFGDADASYSKSPKHVFHSSGYSIIYNVCLRAVINQGCADSICKLDTIYAMPDAAFTYSINGQAVNFAAKMDSTVLYKWKFGNNDSADTRLVTYNYPTPGVYNACLQVTSTFGCFSKSCVKLTVPCMASFSKTGDTAQKFKVFLVNNSSNTTSTTYLWDFGDGGTSTQRTPTHRYSNFGKYIVCLTIKDTGCTSTFCDTIGMDSTGKLLKAGSFELVVIDKTASIGSNKPKSDFTVYPNPTNGKLTVDIGNSTTHYETLEVVDAVGKVCKKIPLESGNNLLELDLQHLKPGLYFIRLSNGEQWSWVRVSKM